ncbi:MAG: polyribonucleotide nucleotidyltransferase [Patescibacteria group bacterium]|jgi:polyribonucleotide nucleotidyltransferase
MNTEKVFTTEWLGRPLTIKTGRLAKQALAAVTVQYGETVVLATVVEAKNQRAGIDYFPLMVDFEERLYAAGVIKGSRWVKREGRPTDDAILAGRMIDRSIRPLFDEASKKDVQVILTTLSADRENDHDIVALNAASAVLSISGLGWNGPIGGVRIGRVEGQFIFNPTYEQREKSDLDLIVAGTKERIIMIEAGASEVKEEDMYEAILAGQKELQNAIKLIEELKEKAGKKPASVEPKKKNLDEEEMKLEVEKETAFELAKKWLAENTVAILFDKEHYTKGERKLAVAAIKEKLEEYLAEEKISKDLRAKAVKELVEPAIEAEVTRGILEKKQRVDGRKLDEIRELEASTSILPRNHGSGLFSRGETQVLSVITLGAPGLEQSLEGIEGVGTKRFMHHYTFPPYSVGEVKPIFSAGRREIGHGALAEKALSTMIPPKEEFPYTIRVVSETLSSNGSSSMASTCGSSLALMDAGVPIKKAVAGIAMGLASNPDMSKWEVLTDLQDLEDGKGGMDFKIAGTRDGITAIQLDTKTIGLDAAIIKKTLEQGKKARLEILDIMEKDIKEPRAELSKYAPRITTLKIDPEKIREVIGSGGKIINAIIAATGVSIDIDDDGLVMICGTDAEKAKEAYEWVNNIVREVQPGEIFTGKVVRMLDFGAFVEILPNRDGMVHVSEMAPYRVGKPSDFLSLGDMVSVQIKEIDDQGRVNLTMKIPENEALWVGEKGKQEGNGFGGGDNGHRPRRAFGGGDRGSRPPRRF